MDKLQISKDYLGKFKQTKVEHEFQEIGLQLQQVFGSSVWPLFHQDGNDDKTMRKLLAEWNKRKAGYMRYLLKEIKK